MRYLPLEVAVRLTIVWTELDVYLMFHSQCFKPRFPPQEFFFRTAFGAQSEGHSCRIGYFGCGLFLQAKRHVRSIPVFTY